MISMHRISTADWVPCKVRQARPNVASTGRRKPECRPRQLSYRYSRIGRSHRTTPDEAGRSNRRAWFWIPKSRSLREQLIAELGAFTDTDALTLWAGRILPQKNQLATADAQALETA